MPSKKVRVLQYTQQEQPDSFIDNAMASLRANAKLMPILFLVVCAACVSSITPDFPGASSHGTSMSHARGLRSARAAAPPARPAPVSKDGDEGLLSTPDPLNRFVLPQHHERILQMARTLDEQHQGMGIQPGLHACVHNILLMESEATATYANVIQCIQMERAKLTEREDLLAAHLSQRREPIPYGTSDSPSDDSPPSSLDESSDSGETMLSANTEDASPTRTRAGSLDSGESDSDDSFGLADLFPDDDDPETEAAPAVEPYTQGATPAQHHFNSLTKSPQIDGRALFVNREFIICVDHRSGHRLSRRRRTRNFRPTEWCKWIDDKENHRIMNEASRKFWKYTVNRSTGTYAIHAQVFRPRGG